MKNECENIPLQSCNQKIDKLEDYFDLTSKNDDILFLNVTKKDFWYCAIIGEKGKEYKGFVLAKTSKMQDLTICNIAIHRPTQSDNYKLKLEFRKTDKELINKTARSNSKEIIIPFKDGEQGYKEFWKMMDFLYNKVYRVLSDISSENSLTKDDEFQDSETENQIISESINNIVSKIPSIQGRMDVLKNLKKLTPENLLNFNNLIDITKLKDLLEKWNENKNNAEEGFWQEFFKEQTWILSQIFACPFVFTQDQLYCGGKKANNKEGVVADFQYINGTSIAIIEIKTPKTTLITNTKYGENIYYVHSDLITAINQNILQRNTWIENKYSVEDSKKIKSANLKGAVIIGSKENLDIKQVETFNLYRSSLKDIEIITYDELYKRIENLLSLFEGEPKVRNQS